MDRVLWSTRWACDAVMHRHSLMMYNAVASHYDALQRLCAMAQQVHAREECRRKVQAWQEGIAVRDNALMDAERKRMRRRRQLMRLRLRQAEACNDDSEQYGDGRAKQTAAATEQVLDGLLGEGGDGTTSVEGVLSGLSAGGVREVAGSLQERIRAAQAAIAAGNFSRQRLQELKKMETLLLLLRQCLSEAGRASRMLTGHTHWCSFQLIAALNLLSDFCHTNRQQSECHRSAAHSMWLRMLFKGFSHWRSIVQTSLSRGNPSVGHNNLRLLLWGSYFQIGELMGQVKCAWWWLIWLLVVTDLAFGGGWFGFWGCLCVHGPPGDGCVRARGYAGLVVIRLVSGWRDTISRVPPGEDQGCTGSNCSRLQQAG